MNVLAIGYLTGKDMRSHLQAEQKRVAELLEEGLIADVFLKADRTGPVLILKDTTAPTPSSGWPPCRSSRSTSSRSS